MAEYRLRLDPEGKEVLEAMLGPLSAPKPAPGCPDTYATATNAAQKP